MGQGVIRLAGALDRLGVPRAALTARRFGFWPNAGLTVLVYHRVADPGAIDGLDPESIDATPEEFDVQMAYVRRHFRPTGLDELLAAHREKRPLPPDSLLVTFDDGFRDNHDNALPILLRHGIKALFFIATGHVTERRLFWWERISLIIRRSAQTQARIDYPQPDVLDLSTDGSRRRAINRMNTVIKGTYDLDLDRFLAGLEAGCGVNWSQDEDRALADRALMGWDEIRALQAAGMGIGSHTYWHRVLETMPPADLAKDLATSRAKLEKEMGRAITTVAYPAGHRSMRAFGSIRKAVADAGYELGFTTVPGTVRPEGDDPYDLQRLPVDRGMPAGLAHMHLCFPALAR